MESEEVVARLTSVRQHTGRGGRAPHKPLLMLLALGKLATTGSSVITWSEVDERLGALLAEFGTAKSTSAAYPFTRLRSDGVWVLSRDVADDSVSQLGASPVEGRLTTDIETALRDPARLSEAARALVDAQFPMTLAPEVLTACGLDPEVVYAAPGSAASAHRQRDARWRERIIAAWDRSCAFCGYDGSLGGATVGLDAAHVRWFKFDGPDDPDNGIALCALHHRLLDAGALGMSDPETVMVSHRYAAVSPLGRSLYDLHGRVLRPRPGTPLPLQDHIDWHRREVFKGEAVA